jgi:type IX secretion system PorP/SprF family membrane protein
LYLNPALTGTTELPRVVLNYRNQWPQKGATYTTYSISYDQISNKLKTGFGFQLYHDRELNNVVNSSSGSFSYSYHIKLSPISFMTLGLQAGMVLKQFDANNLIFPSEIDQLSGEVTGGISAYSDEKKVYPDFAVGALGQHNDIYWGASFHHLARPDESIIEGDQKGKLPVKITMHIGAKSRKFHHGLLSRRFTLSPNILYQQQGSFKQLNLGIYMIEKSLLFGGWYRNNLDIRPDAFIILAGMARNKFRFGYSFDLTLSKLSNYSYGSHELSLTFFLGSEKEVPIRNKLLIPIL